MQPVIPKGKTRQCSDRDDRFDREQLKTRATKQNRQLNKEPLHNDQKQNVSNYNLYCSRIEERNLELGTLTVSMKLSFELFLPMQWRREREYD